MNKIKILLVFLIILIISSFFSLSRQKPVSQKEEEAVSVAINNEIKEEEIEDFPTLSLPKEYFPKEFKDQKAVYQSYPTTEVTIKEFSNTKVPLEYKSIEDINKDILESYGEESSKTWLVAAQENFKKFGNLATYYLPESYIHKVDQIDVDGDGVAEKIVTHMLFGSADGGGYMTDIIKGDAVIFQAQEKLSNIVKADTVNGFFVEWQNESIIWVEGFIRTRFVWKDNQFVPVYEQEVRFVETQAES